LNKHIQELMFSLLKHCRNTLGHSLRVADELQQLCTFIGMGSSAKFFYMGALHDIGKLKIDRTLLNKTEKLTDFERTEFKRHTQYGRELLKDRQVFSEDFLNNILFHHENIDGSGYYGLKGKEIPLYARMIRIIDTYDAMTYGRIYQEPICEDKVKAEMEVLKGTTLDEILMYSYFNYLETKKHRLLENTTATYKKALHLS